MSNTLPPTPAPTDPGRAPSTGEVQGQVTVQGPSGTRVTISAAVIATVLSVMGNQGLSCSGMLHGDLPTRIDALEVRAEQQDKLQVNNLRNTLRLLAFVRKIPDRDGNPLTLTFDEIAAIEEQVEHATRGSKEAP
jgi:hypothetical protein